MTVDEIVKKLGISLDDVIGDKKKIIKKISPRSNATENQLTFCKIGRESKLFE